MAFPVVQGRATGRKTSAGTSHSITLPSGIVAGERLLVVFSYNGDIFSGIDSASASAGWTELLDGVSGTGLFICTKIATGSDSLTITTNDSFLSAHSSLRIKGGSSVELGATAAGALEPPNPPPLTPADGYQDYLWIPAAGIRESNAATFIDAAPSGYGNLNQIGTGGSSGSDVSVATAEKSSSASTEDPGKFGISAGSPNQFFTLVIAVWTDARAGFGINF